MLIDLKLDNAIAVEVENTYKDFSVEGTYNTITKHFKIAKFYNEEGNEVVFTPKQIDTFIEDIIELAEDVVYGSPSDWFDYSLEEEEIESESDGMHIIDEDELDE